MGKKIYKLVVVLVVLTGAGVAKFPFEKRFTKDLTERRLMPPPISLGIYADLRQSSFAGVLGGLRSVVASITHLQAHRHFEFQEWFELKKDYDTIVALDPRNLYYWQTGGWHLAYNAAADARNREDLRPVEQRTLEKEYLEQGDAFFRAGAKANPDQAGPLWTDVGRLWSNPFKRPDFARSAAAFEKALEADAPPVVSRSHLYSLARVPGQEEKAWTIARDLVEKDPAQLKIPTFSALYYVLGNRTSVPEKDRPALADIFPNDSEAYQQLHNYKLRAEGENFPLYGVDLALRDLLTRLEVPDQFNSFTDAPKRMIQRAGQIEKR